MNRRVSLAAVLLAGIGCAKPAPVPEPVSPQSSLVGVSIRSQGLLGLRGAGADVVFFMRLGEGDDPYRTGTIVPSSLRVGDYVYLMNAPAGRYSIIGSYWRTGIGRRTTAYYITVLSDSTRRALEFALDSGGVTYAGSLQFRIAEGRDSSDAVGEAMMRIMGPGETLRSIAAHMMVPKTTYIGRLQERADDAAAQAAFFARARLDLGPVWAAALERRAAADQTR